MLLGSRKGIVVGIDLSQQFEFVPLPNKGRDALHEEAILVAAHNAHRIFARLLSIGTMANAVKRVRVLV